MRRGSAVAAHAGTAPHHAGQEHATTSAPGAPGAARAPSPRRIASSPAVGYFLPRDGLAAGQVIKQGDIVGHVEVLGVRQDVVAPLDGVVGRIMATAGEAVEYGQELVRIDGLERLPPGSGEGSAAVEAGEPDADSPESRAAD